MVSFDKGQVYTSFIVVRFVGRKDGTDIISYETRSLWPKSGIKDVAIELDRDCLSVACDNNEQCIAGECGGLPSGDIFENEDIRDVGVSCDRTARVNI